ncbi:MAG: lysophospholipid acyltransferase family protein [Spirochaetota bacterium]
MLKSIQILVAACYVLLHFIVSMLFGLIPAAILSTVGLRRWADPILRVNGVLLSKGIICALGGRVHVIGSDNIPKDESRICFVSNHQSYADIPLLVSYLPMLVGFITKVELRKIPILRSWIRALGCVYIDRSSTRSSIQAIFDGVERIKQGHPLVIFPEGTRSKSDTVGQLKEGSLKLATRSKAVIVPLTIQGTHKLLEKMKSSKFRQDVYLIIHEPLPTEQLSEQQLKAIPEKVFSKIRMQ